MKFSFARGVAALFVAMPFASSAQEASADPDLLEEIIVTAQKRATSLQDVPFSIAAMTAEDLEQSRRHQHRRSGSQCARPLHRRSRPRSEPGCHPRHQRRPGRARSARCEGIRRHLSRRIADLRGAVHAGSRPVRPRPRRSAARPAGHAVRRRLLLGHGALHHRATEHRRVRRFGRPDGQRSHRR